MKKISFPWLALIFVICLSLISTSCAGGEQNSGGGTALSQANSPNGASGQPISVNLKAATSNTQTSVYLFTAALGEILSEAKPIKINLDILPYAGAIGNVELVTRKEADFATSFNVTNKWAYDGVVAYDHKFEDIRGLVGGLNQYYVGIIASDEFLKKYNLTSLAQIKEKKIPVRIITNTVGTLAEFNTRHVLQAYGLNDEMIKSFGGSVEFTSNDVIKAKFQNGTADLHILAMTKAHPVITEIALQTDIAVLPLEDITTDLFKQYGYTQEVFPKGEFKGQSEDIHTVGFVTGYITHKDMSDEVAYTITKAVVENKAALVYGHKSVEDFDPQKAADPDSLGIPLHPGAVRYYKEVGILK
ncbi:TAXI family TRAP transporter solute-binding subunit [Brevibacillus sp. H7]|uniref:TAXI family TRAP transporter solute-binding subunit n=1 Tax=Brevibacillus sp. H7 TaxID=3349138 RepID=UPI0037F8E3CC